MQNRRSLQKEPVLMAEGYAETVKRGGPESRGSQWTCMGLVFVKIYGLSCGLCANGALTRVALFDQTDRCFVPICDQDCHCGHAR